MHVKLSQYRDVIAALQDPTLRQGLYDDGQVIMDSVLLTLHGDAHRIRRRLEQKLFTRPNIRFYETQVIPTLLKQYIDPFMTEGGGDILPLTLKTSMGLTALIAGLDVPPGDDQAILRLLDLVKTFSEGATLVHSTRPKEEVEGEVLAALANLEEEFLIPSIQRRQALLSEIRSGQGDEAALPKDVLITLMKAGAQHPLERDVLRREIAFYLQAGAHSTANSTAHALWDILRWRAPQIPRLTPYGISSDGRIDPIIQIAWKTRSFSNGVFMKACAFIPPALWPFAAQKPPPLSLTLKRPIRIQQSLVRMLPYLTLSAPCRQAFPPTA